MLIVKPNAPDKAHDDPTAPTHIPHTKFARPAVRPEAKMQYPEVYAACAYRPVSEDGATYSIFVCKMMAIMTPEIVKRNVSLVYRDVLDDVWTTVRAEVMVPTGKYEP